MKGKQQFVLAMWWGKQVTSLLIIRVAFLIRSYYFTNISAIPQNLEPPLHKRNPNILQYLYVLIFICYYIYQPRSITKQGDNALGSVCLSICLSVLSRPNRLRVSGRVQQRGTIVITSLRVYTDNRTDTVHWLLIIYPITGTTMPITVNKVYSSLDLLTWLMTRPGIPEAGIPPRIMEVSSSSTLKPI